MGIHGQMQHPLFLEACEKVSRECAAHQLVAGIFLRKKEEIQAAVALGFSLIAVGSDLGILKAGMKTGLTESA